MLSASSKKVRQESQCYIATPGT